MDRRGSREKKQSAAGSIAVVESAPGRRQLLWTRGNRRTSVSRADAAHTARGRFSLGALRFRGQGGVATYSTTICISTSGDQKLFVIQMLPEPARGADAKGASVDATVHKQKLDCALQMARTVSLDFNNALASILGHTSFMLTKMEPGAQWRSSLLEVEKSAAKAAEIANDLATFSRQEKEARTQASGNLNELVVRCVDSFKRNLPPGQVKWVLQTDRRLFLAKFDEAKMLQALMKIVENSVEASGDSGRISFLTRNVELKEPTQDRGVQLMPGNYICLEVSDTGKGIEPDILPRVFEPFFTTRELTIGTGLGLSQVYGFVKQTGGDVVIESELGHGTKVVMYLPMDEQIVEPKKLILIVDDEVDILEVLEPAVISQGYEVHCTANPTDAIKFVEDTYAPFKFISQIGKRKMPITPRFFAVRNADASMFFRYVTWNAARYSRVSYLLFQCGCLFDSLRSCRMAA